MDVAAIVEVSRAASDLVTVVLRSCGAETRAGNAGTPGRGGLSLPVVAATEKAFSWSRGVLGGQPGKDGILVESVTGSR